MNTTEELHATPLHEPVPPAWHSYESVCVDGTWYHTHFIKEVVEQLKRKAPIVRAGLDEYSKAEIFALHILKESSRLDF